MKNLQKIWQRFVDNDETALILIYNEYANQLFAYGMRIVSDEDLVKDSIQDVFIGLIDNRKRITITPRTQYYLFKSLRNKLYEVLRDKNRNPLYMVKADEERAGTEQSVEAQIIENEIEQDKRRKVQNAIKNLSDKQQEILHLRFTDGLEYDEIAAIMDIDVASARTSVYRSLKTLRKSIGFIAIILMMF